MPLRGTLGKMLMPVKLVLLMSANTSQSTVKYGLHLRKQSSGKRRPTKASSERKGNNGSKLTSATKSSKTSRRNMHQNQDIRRQKLPSPQNHHCQIEMRLIPLDSMAMTIFSHWRFHPKEIKSLMQEQDRTLQKSAGHMKERSLALTSQRRICQMASQSRQRQSISATFRYTMLTTGKSSQTQATAQF